MKRDWDKILTETYTAMFAVSDPPADFAHLVETGTINDRRQIEIMYNNHIIQLADYNRIMAEMIKKYKLKGRNEQSFQITICLGCSPRIAR
jgi:hypothetical protein